MQRIKLFVFGFSIFILFLDSSSLQAQNIVVRNIDYKDEVVNEDGKDLLDIYMPEEANNVPVIVFFHGGGLRIGNKEDAQEVATRFVAAGVGVVSANYRLSPAVMHPAHVRDAAAATAWAIENIARYGGNPRNIYVGGHSAGAYLATLLVLDSSHLARHGITPEMTQGAIAISPFLYVEETAKVRPKVVWGNDPVNWLAASVTPHIQAGKKPVLVIYADGDAQWRKQQNQAFVAAMRLVANKAQVFEVPDRDHMSLINGINRKDDEILGLVLKFIKAN